MPFVRGETFGNFGDIFIENVNVTQLEATYHYTPLSFMELGGTVDNFTLKNVRFSHPDRNSLFIDLGRPFFYRPKEMTAEEVEKFQICDGDDLSESIYWMPKGARPLIKNFTLENVVFNSDSKTDNMDYISVKHNIGNLILKDIKLFRDDTAFTSGAFVRMSEEANVDNLFLENIYAERLDSIISGTEEHKINLLRADNVILKGGKAVFDIDKIDVKFMIKDDIYEI